MEELSNIAMAYYQASSDQHQELALEFFRAMDHDGDGKIDQKEFIEFLIDEGYAQMTRSCFFEQLDLDKNGTLDFCEVMTLYYILKSGRPFCDKCNMFIPNTYFTCVGCLEDEDGVSIHLCLKCYIAQKCDHNHNGLSRYVDNYSLLEATLKSKLNTARSRPSETDLVLDKPSSMNYQASTMDQVSNRPPTAHPQNLVQPVYHQTYIQNNYSFHHSPPHLVQTPAAANANVPERQRWKVAFGALNTALYVGAAGSNLCSIL